jgi:hypothetical protein
MRERSITFGWAGFPAEHARSLRRKIAAAWARRHRATTTPKLIRHLVRECRIADAEAVKEAAV